MAAAPARWSRSQPLRVTRVRVVITLRDITAVSQSSWSGHWWETETEDRGDGGMVPGTPASPRRGQPPGQLYHIIISNQLQSGHISPVMHKTVLSPSILIFIFCCGDHVLFSSST